MHTKKLFFIGAGGHCKVVVDSFLIDPSCNVEAIIVDSNQAFVGQYLIDNTKIELFDQKLVRNNLFHVSIGSNKIRKNIFEQCCEAGGIYTSILHPNAQVSSFCKIENGCFVAGQSVVSADACIKKGVIVNHGAVVDHDCKVGQFSHIAPNATLGGGVSIGENVLIGAGAVILPGVNIAANVVVGAGSLVTKDITSGDTYIGSPAVQMLRS